MVEIMSNPILNRALEKAASLKGAIKTFKEFPAHNKVGLTLGVTSLGLGSVNFANNLHNTKVTKARQDLEAKSLAALNRIHAVLEKGEGNA
jgi:hypothetical protein